MCRSARLLAGLSALGAIVALAMAPGASAAATASLTAFTVSPTQVAGGNNSLKLPSGMLLSPVSGSVTLTDLTVKNLLAQPPQPQTVTLSSTNPAVATVPATVSVVPGQTETFAITTTAVSITTIVQLSASFGGTTLTTNLTVDPPSVNSLVLSPSTVVGGNDLSATACLNGPAPANGATLDLTTSDTSLATVPVTLNLAAGQRCASFAAQTTAVWSVSNVSLSAITHSDALRFIRHGLSATLVLQPPSAMSVTLSDVPAHYADGAHLQPFGVCLNGPAPAGGVNVSVTSTMVSLDQPVVPVATGNRCGTGYFVAPPVSTDSLFSVTASFNGAVTDTATVHQAVIASACITGCPGITHALVDGTTILDVGMAVLVNLSDAFPTGATVHVSHAGTATPTIDLPSTLTYDPTSWHAFHGWMVVHPCGAQYADYCQDTITFTYGNSSKTVVFTVNTH